MGRSYCPCCRFPDKTCLCDWVHPIESPIDIIILQHPNEALHAKNTVRLLSLGLTNISVFEGEGADDFEELDQACSIKPESYILCFPSEQSIPIEESLQSTSNNKEGNQKKSIIFIDASWRKALRMWHLNPWLQGLTCWHFDSPPENQYKIRSTSRPNSLSTLEAVTYVLNLMCQVDCSNLMALFKARQSHFRLPEQ